MSDSLQPHGLQLARLPCPSPTPRAYSNLCPSSQWWHPTISSSVIPFSPSLKFFPASGSFPMSQFFTCGGQRIGVSASASVLPMNIQDWFPLRLTSLISLKSKGLSKVFSNITVQKHQFFVTQLSLWSNSHILPGSSIGKESACNAGDPDLASRLGRSVEKGQATHFGILGLPLWLSWLRIHLQCGRPGFDP